MRYVFAIVVALTAAGAAPSAAPAQTADPDDCTVPEQFTHVEGRLPRVALMARDKKLDILVEGTGSSTLGGPGGPRNAYPARLQAALESRLPGVAVAVKTDVKARRTTADMAQAIRTIPESELPGLVIWQAGTVDAMRGVDPDEFRAALEEGVRILRKRAIDVMLVNMQYSPRTEAMITIEPYAEAMRWVAQQHDVPLFDRLGVMKHWSEAGVFDFTSTDRSRIAERVHDCIGKLLAATILDSAGLYGKKMKDRP